MSAAGSSSKTSDNSLDGPRVVWEPSMGLAWVPTSEFVGVEDVGVGLTPEEYGEAELVERHLQEEVDYLVNDASSDLLV